MKGLSQLDAPLYQAARAYLKRNYISLHVPLHGRGEGAPHLKHSGFASLLRWDLTEVENLDDLHLPGGPLHHAQMLAARLFGAAQTFFLVNGVTGGLLSLLSAVIRPGEKVLLSRLSHKAALHGIILSGAIPVYLPVEQEPRSGFPLNVSVSLLKRALKQHPDVRLVLLTSPTYWGVTAPLGKIARLCRDLDVLLAVDEAHGAHLPFYGDLPHSAVSGADFWLHSAHKSLGALTPGAFLHLAAALPSQRLRFWLQALQTSSPSYPVMISMDLARRQAALDGKHLFRRARHWSRILRRALVEEGIGLLSEEAVRAAGFDLDPCRATLLLPRGGGMELARRLARNCCLQVEMCGDNYLLAVCGPAQINQSPLKLARAVGRVAPEKKESTKNYVNLLPPYCFTRNTAAAGNLDPFTLAPGEAVLRPALSILLEKSVGRICAEMVVSAPPGIPLLAPGEHISMEMVSVLVQLRNRKARFQGAADPALNFIKCLV